MKVTSHFFFSHNVFYPIKEKNHPCSSSYFVICKCFKFGLIQNFVIYGKESISFSTWFDLCCSGQYTFPCFAGICFTSTMHDILSKPLAAFPHNHHWTMLSEERGKNPVAMSNINPPLSPARWHDKHIYLSSLGIMGTTQFFCRSHNS